MWRSNNAVTCYFFECILEGGGGCPDIGFDMCAVRVVARAPPMPLLQLCILAGCDYLSSVPSVGIMTAYRLIKEHRTFVPVGYFVCSDIFVGNVQHGTLPALLAAFCHCVVYDVWFLRCP